MGAAWVQVPPLYLRHAIVSCLPLTPFSPPSSSSPGMRNFRFGRPALLAVCLLGAAPDKGSASDAGPPSHPLYPPLYPPHQCRTVMMFPSSMGGSSLSSEAFKRLQQCPVADPPCTDQQVGARRRWQQHQATVAPRPPPLAIST